MENTLALVIPLHNEADCIDAFDRDLRVELKKLKQNVHIYYVDDGSSDNTLTTIQKIANTHNDTPENTSVIALTRNFGKEIALSAGIAEANKHAAIICLDGDGQHPVSMIGQFIDKWHGGESVVFGRRKDESNLQKGRGLSSRAYHFVARHILGIEIDNGLTDFMLIDREVAQAFTELPEQTRITRGLVKWLGYSHATIEFSALERIGGESSYSFKKLYQLALHSAVSLSSRPLYVGAYVGMTLLPIVSLLAIIVFINACFDDPLELDITGSGYMNIILLFLMSILLALQGIIGLYLSKIHAETKRRPLYVINRKQSIGVRKRTTEK